MKPPETPRLILRNWEDRDRELFHRINSNDAVMAFFEMRRTRQQSDELLDQIATGIAQRGYGFWAVERRDTGDCIGFTGLLPTNAVPSRPSRCVEIGWRLAPEHWGHGYVTEAANACLAFGFEELGLKEIVSFAVTTNHRSTAVMKRIGMVPEPSGDFDHPQVSQENLKRHVLYTLTAEQWRGRNQAPGQK